MAVQWAVHIPQAMQRHGASVKPCADDARDNMRAYRAQQATLQATVQSDMPKPQFDETQAGIKETAH